MDLRYWKVQISKKIFPRRIYQFNPTKIPFIARKIKKKFLEGDDLLVIPRDETININRYAERPYNEILPSEVIEYFIKKAGYICIINTCLCRDALRCKNYPAEPGCVYLGEAARGVHPKLGHQASAEEAIAHIHRSRELGLVHLIGRSRLDCITHGIGPGDKLMSICNCCPCCCVSRGMAYSPSLLGENFNRFPGIRINITDRCKGCGVCADRKLNKKVCIYHAISLKNTRAVIDQNKCRGCSRCVTACPNKAIEVHIEDSNYIQHTIERLEKAVRVT